MTTDLSHSTIARFSPITVADHHRQATLRFTALSGALSRALPGLVMETAHIGGTAVPGLTGRATIDILVIVADLFTFDQRNPEVARLGYINCGDGGISGQRLFKLGRGFNCDALLYVYEPGDRTALHHLLIRDFLRSNTEETRSFAELKSRLAERHIANSTAYVAGKRPRLRRLLERATGRC